VDALIASILPSRLMSGPVFDISNEGDFKKLISSTSVPFRDGLMDELMEHLSLCTPDPSEDVKKLIRLADNSVWSSFEYRRSSV
jgi:hypothetical protein